MKQKRVWRYWCDYCGKGGLQKGHMAKHEKRCTMNPNRECGMCALYEMETKPMSELLEILKPAADGWHKDEFWHEFETFTPKEEILKVAMEKLHKVTNGCPACKLAALRQSRIPVPVTDFDFKQECHEWWQEFNNEQAQSAYYG